MSKVGLEVQSITKKFGQVIALDNFSLKVGVGEMVALLGPSGCGKTTALRIVAGLERQDSGSISLGIRDMTNVPAHLRNMGMVFQSYSLFPNLDVEENVSFGLKMRRVDRTVRKKKSDNLLELVGLASHHKRFPHQLSGGQQQRVALARALAIEPEILLLDEPLSALDAQVRANLREEIRRLQLSLGTTALFVTHDQEEAMAISDRVGVMSHGKLEQIANPDELYNHPATEFVATFVGMMNRIPGNQNGDSVVIFGQRRRVKNHNHRFGETFALVRPEDIKITEELNNPNATVLTRSFLGASSRVLCRTKEGHLIQALVPSGRSSDLRPGVAVELDLYQSEVLVADD